jgi:hypothetical protein
MWLILSGHSGIPSNELVDGKAKKAAEGNTSEKHLLPASITDCKLCHSISSMQTKYMKLLKAYWHNT